MLRGVDFGCGGPEDCDAAGPEKPLDVVLNTEVEDVLVDSLVCLTENNTKVLAEPLLLGYVFLAASGHCLKECETESDCPGATQCLPSQLGTPTTSVCRQP